MGARDSTFLVRGTQVDVLRNVHGGVEDAGVSFAITPPPAAKNKDAFTPSRVLLTGEYHALCGLKFLYEWRAVDLIFGKLRLPSIISMKRIIIGFVIEVLLLILFFNNCLVFRFQVARPR